MNTYQFYGKEYACPSCAMNYAAIGENAEEAARSIYTTHLDPKGVLASSLKWDEDAQTLHTGVGEYLELKPSSKASQTGMSDALKASREVQAAHIAELEESEESAPPLPFHDILSLEGPME